MTNKERIERLRKCASFDICNPEICDLWQEDDCRSILLKDAADALEAAEKRIAELEAQIPKEGKWIPINWTYDSILKCSNCGELACCCGDYCPNCGAKMTKGEQE